MTRQHHRLDLLVLAVFATLLQGRECAAFRPPLLSEELGCSPTLSLLFNQPDGLYFDPLGFATDTNFPRLRESELKHGRIAMMAVLGYTIPPVAQMALDGVGASEKFPGGSILDNLGALDAWNLINVVVTCGFLEAFIFIQRSPTDLPGDYSIGYFGVRDKGANERALVSELENGRLAMLAITGQVVSEIVTGQSWLEQWKHIVGDIVQWIQPDRGIDLTPPFLQ